MAPKSILKKSSQFERTSDDTLPSRPKVYSDDHRRIALQHANILQHRKNIEAANLEAIEELMEFPTDPNIDPSSPPSSDVARFQRLVESFQASDYEELLVERNCLEKCGYVFCPRQRERDKTGPLLDLVPSNKSRSHLWCSDLCARRSLFVKTQLDEQPAWERAERCTKPVELLDQHRIQNLNQTLNRVGVDGSDGVDLHKAIAELALERGEMASSSKGERFVGPVKESVPTNHTLMQNLTQGSAGDIEGYASRTASWTRSTLHDTSFS